MVWLIGWMRPVSPGRRHRQGHVGALAGQPLGQRGAAEPLAGLGERGGDPVLAAAFSAAPASRRSLGRQRAEAAHRRGDRAAAAEQP